MIVHAQYRNPVSHALEQEPSGLLWEDVADNCPGDDIDGDTAEICRMIEFSGMIGLECGLLGGE